MSISFGRVFFIFLRLWLNIVLIDSSKCLWSTIWYLLVLEAVSNNKKPYALTEEEKEYISSQKGYKNLCDRIKIIIGNQINFK